MMTRVLEWLIINDNVNVNIFEHLSIWWLLQATGWTRGLNINAHNSDKIGFENNCKNHEFPSAQLCIDATYKYPIICSLGL